MIECCGVVPVDEFTSSLDILRLILEVQRPLEVGEGQDVAVEEPYEAKRC